ncbi:MAG TPA: hypothetical protein VGE76_08600, partial [Opitutaceae bacterium]
EVFEREIIRDGNVFEINASERETGPGHDALIRSQVRIVLIDASYALLVSTDVGFAQEPGVRNQIFYTGMSVWLMSRAPLPAPTTERWAGSFQVTEHGHSAVVLVEGFAPTTTARNFSVDSAGGGLALRLEGDERNYPLAESGGLRFFVAATPRTGRLNPGQSPAFDAREDINLYALLQLDAQRAALLSTTIVGASGNPGSGSAYPVIHSVSARVGIAQRIVQTAPTVTRQPADLAVLAGGDAFIAVTAEGAPAPQYRWELSTNGGTQWEPLSDGGAFSGTATATLVVRAPTAVMTGHRFRVRVTNAMGTVVSNAATLKVLASPTARLPNLSIRTALAAGQTLIAGFVMQGGSKPLLLRAVGPQLADFGLTGVMADPRIDFYNAGGAKIAENNDWTATTGAVFSQVGAFGLTGGSKDAALSVTLSGASTAQVSGVGGGGTVLVEVYDAGTGNETRLANVSARNRVGTGGDILIAGFVVTGSDPKNVLIRAVGPTLGAFGVAGSLSDPRLAVYDGGGGKVAENDNWSSSLAPAFTNAGAFGLGANSLDAALLLTLPPGAYTAQVSGNGGATGEALIEIYELP